MTSQEILNQMPFVLVHPLIFAIISGCIMFLGGMILDFVINTESKNGSSSGSTAIGIVGCIMIIGGILGAIASVTGPDFLLNNTSKNRDRINLLRQAPIEVTKTQTINLVSAQSAGFADTTVNGNAWSISGTTGDTSSYRYIIKNGDTYQVKTLHDQFGKVNADDVSIKQEHGRKQTQLVVESKQYKDPRIRELISMTTWSPKWQTYTFKVGDGAISTTTSFK